MAALLKKIQDAISNRTTYRLGMLQTRVYRMLNQETAKALVPYGLMPPEWAMLGIITDMPAGARFSTIADEVGVEPPFVTVMARTLIKKGLILEKKDPNDSRAKLLCVTPEGKRLVPVIEKHVRDAMRPVVDGIPRGDLLTYLSVLSRLSERKTK